MIYVVEVTVDDATKRHRFFDAPQEARAFFDKAAPFMSDGVPIRRGEPAFVEAARLLSIDAPDRATAKQLLEEKRVEVLRDSEAEKKTFFDELLADLEK